MTLDTRTTGDFTLDGSWGVVGILPGGFLMSGLELTLWKMKGADPDFGGQVPSLLAVVRVQHLNMVLEAGKARPGIELDRLGGDVLLTENLQHASFEMAVKLLNRSDDLADKLSRAHS